MRKKWVFDGDKAFGKWTYDCYKLAFSIFERLDDNDLNDGEDSDKWELITNALNDEMIYYSQQWVVLKEYCTPREANWDEAISEFMDDLFYVINIEEVSDDE